MREQVMETERLKKQGQAALERKGKRGVDTSEIGRQDWDRQAVQRQNGVGRAEREASDW